MVRKLLVLFFILTLTGTLIFAGENTEETEEITADPFAEIDKLYFSRDEGNNLETYKTKLEELLAEDPDNGEIYWRLSRYYYWKGKLADEKDDKLENFEKGQETAEKGIEKDPDNAGVYYWTGANMGMIGDTRGVLKSFFLIDPIKDMMNKTLERDPNHDGAHHVLGVMYRKLPGFKGGSNEKSVKELLEAVKLKPNDTLHRYELALTYLEMDQEMISKKQLNFLIDIEDPSDPVQAKINREEAKELLEDLED